MRTVHYQFKIRVLYRGCSRLRVCEKRALYSGVPRKERFFSAYVWIKTNSHYIGTKDVTVLEPYRIYKFLYFPSLRISVNFSATEMKIGCPAETKVAEGRVGLSPDGALELVLAGHEVFIQKDAGLKSGFTNEQYTKNGATLAENMEDIYARADMIVKVRFWL